MNEQADNLKVGDIAASKLIQAGLELFGQRGYDGVSVRQLSDQAGMNIASINYHFGNKYGLYTAVADYINEKLSAATQSSFSEAQQFILNPNGDSAAAIQQILKVIGNLVDVIMSDSPETEAWVRFINRFENGDHIPNHALGRELLNTVLSALVGIARNSPEKKLENAMIAQTIFGQVLVFRVDNFTSKQALNIEHFGSNEVKLIKKIIFENIKKILSW